MLPEPLFHDIIGSTRTEVTRVVLPLPPPLNSVYRYGKGAYYKSSAAKDFTEEVGWRLIKSRPIPKGTMVGLALMFRIKRDADIDSRLKVLLDSLQGFFYESDIQIFEMPVYKRLVKDNPHVELVLYTITEAVGV